MAGAPRLRMSTAAPVQLGVADTRELERSRKTHRVRHQDVGVLGLLQTLLGGFPWSLLRYWIRVDHLRYEFLHKISVLDMIWTPNKVLALSNLRQMRWCQSFLGGFLEVLLRRFKDLFESRTPEVH